MSSPFDFTGMRSPPRRPIIIPSPTSPFCTSPSQLEDVTLDAEPSIYSAGLRSPILGSRGRSIKEFEEQLSGLRKENFNLKLRIYFLEERLGNNFTLDQEDAVKKNIEMMVEMESLKKEVQEKQDLLCQAVKAMELEEDEHRKENENKDKQLKEIRAQLDNMQRQYDMLHEGGHSQVELTEREFYNNATSEEAQEVIAHLENRIADLEEQLRADQQQNHASNMNVSLTHAIDELQSTLSTNEEKLREAVGMLEAKCSLVADLQGKLDAMEVELEGKKHEAASLKWKLEETQTELREAQLGMEELQKANVELGVLYENECKRNERHRVAISHRNAKIAELEGSAEKHKLQMSNLELKLETAVNEVKGKSDDDHAGSPRVLNLTDGASLSVRSASPHADDPPAAKPLAAAARSPRMPNFKSKTTTTLSPTTAKANASGDEARLDDGADALTKRRTLSLEEMHDELLKYRRHIAKLEQDQLKACRIIQTMLETRKRNGKEIEDLQRGLQRRDALIQDLRAKHLANETFSTRSSSNGGGHTGNDRTDGRKSLRERVSELNLTAAAPSTDTERSMIEDGHDPLLLLDQYKQLANDMETQKQILVDTLKEKDIQMKELEVKYEVVCRDLKSKENRIVDMEFELLNTPDNEKNITKEKVDSGNEKISFWIRESEEKDREIEKLEKELAKRTHDLQGVVNKELWQKNREIERLQKFVTGVEKKDLEIGELKKQLNDYENKLKVYAKRLKGYEDAKKRERDDIQEKLNSSNEDRNDLLIELNELNHQVVQMTKDSQNLKEELRLSDELRTETQEICCLLGKRLEELALFLDTLLKQKSVLGFLGHKQNKMLRQRVEQSLDLSKSLSMSLHLNPDQSLMQLSNISEILNNSMTPRNDTMQSINLSATDANLSIVPDNITLTYQSHLNVRAFEVKEDQGEIIRVLREQIDKLKSEIELRDNELAERMSSHNLAQNELIEQLAELSGTSQVPLTAEEILQRLKMHGDRNKSKTLDNSDSESWSEPDRSVSKARIGLDDKALKPKTKMISESTEIDARPVSRTPSKKSIGNEGRFIINQLTDQISQLETLVKEKDELLAKAVAQQHETNNKFLELQANYNEVTQRCEVLEERLIDLNKNYSELDTSYQNLEKTYKSEKDKFEETRNDREKLQETVRGMENTLRAAIDAKMATENEIILLKGKIENLETYKALLTDSMDTKTKCIQNRLNELEVEKNQAQQDAKAAEEKLNDAVNEIARVSDKLLSLEISHAKSTAAMISEAEKEVQRRVREAEKTFKDKVEAIEKNAQNEVQKIREEAEQTLKKYESDYVERTELERLQIMIKELESVQGVLAVSEKKVQELEASEHAIKQQLYESECMYRNKLNELRRDLDAATLHCSQLQLEKTKTEEEKAHLQTQVKTFTEREDAFESQVADLKNEFNALKDNFKRQLVSLETERSHLQVKISSLETLNADLNNQLARSQYPEAHKTQSAPSTPTGRILDLYLSKNQFYAKQYNDLQPFTSSHSFTISRTNDQENVENIDVDRIQANSSPDLGIESDQGRFSSLEAQMVSLRPLQPVINITTSLTENLDKHQNSLAPANSCDKDKCVAVVKEMHSENFLLKRKLQKSNKLLEETLSQLAKANQRKREVEKNICKQIHKTSQVLKIAKANLDSGSDTELIRK